MTLAERRPGHRGPRADGRCGPAPKLLLGDPEAKLLVALESSCLQRAQGLDPPAVVVRGAQGSSEDVPNPEPTLRLPQLPGRRALTP